jgi:hypothetical protein
MSNDTGAGGVHRWWFFRYGGFDQVAIESGDDLRHLAAVVVMLVVLWRQGMFAGLSAG